MYNYQNIPYNYDSRFGGFIVPFLLGGLGGSAIVGLSRPRPVVVNQSPYPYYNPYYY
jgi:hypothetical protein